MIPYLFIFFINIFFCYIADANFCKNKRIYYFSLVFIIAINTLFCGFRDFGVGQDTLVYIEDYYSDAQFLYSFYDFVTYKGDIAFLTMAKISSFFGGGAQALLVLVELWIITFVVLGMDEIKKILPLSLPVFMTFFCLELYCHSINLMRQFCAIAILFWGFPKLVKGNYIGYIVCQILAYFFHSTAVLFIIIPCTLMLSRTKSLIIKFMIPTLFLIMLFHVVNNLNDYLDLLAGITDHYDVLSERYSEGGEYENNQTRFTGITYIFWLFSFYFILYGWKKKAIKGEEAFLSVILLLVIIAIQHISLTVMFTSRLAFYLSIIYYLYISVIVSNKKIFILYKGGMLFISLYTWIKVFALANGGEVIPYTSKILGI